MGQKIRMTAFALLTCVALAQNRPSPQGETALKTQFVEVEPDVKLEVLDWGGTGRELVLLAGLGNTAHVFDSLGPKLAAHYNSQRHPLHIPLTRGGSDLTDQRLREWPSAVMASFGSY
jgi:hypothetical protein